MPRRARKLVRQQGGRVSEAREPVFGTGLVVTLPRTRAGAGVAP